MSFRLQHCSLQSGAESAARRAAGELQGSTRQGAACSARSSWPGTGKEPGAPKGDVQGTPCPPWVRCSCGDLGDIALATAPGEIVCQEGS